MRNFSQRSQRIAVWISAFAALCLPSVRGAEPPNLVFLIADDLGWADVEFHGGNVPTPNLNRLLEEGVELSRQYVAPVCSPTRAGFLTGRYWSRFGITTPTNSQGLPFDTMTLPRALRDAGYETCLVGKWHLGSQPEWGPNQFGFDHSYGSLAGGVAPYNHHYKKGPHTVTWHRNGELIEEEGHVTDLLVSEATRWISDRKEGSPFFLYVPFTAVHLPIREPEGWLQKVPDSIKGEVPRQYAACILHLDDAVGKIVDAIDDSGNKNNTLVVFTSDNGGSTAENNDTKYPDDQCPNGRLPGNNLPLRGQKGTSYEGGIRVPTIVRWPGTLEAGTRFDTPVQITDWMPTFCSLAGSKVKSDQVKWDGRDIGPWLTGREKPEARSIYNAGPHFRTTVLLKENWKLIVSAAKGDAPERSELYDLGKDPNETTNLAADFPEEVAALREELTRAASSDRDAVVKSP